MGYYASSGQGAEEADYYFDQQTMRVDSLSSVLVWGKWIFPNPAPRKAAYELIRWKVDCVNMRNGQLSWAHYDKSGKSLFSGNVEPNQFEWVDIIPDSIGEDAAKAQCAIARKRLAGH